jgi:hypothetical protein
MGYLEVGTLLLGAVRPMIKKQGSHYEVKSESGKNLGHYPSKKQAETRLRQVEYFKAHPNKAARGKK